MWCTNVVDFVFIDSSFQNEIFRKTGWHRRKVKCWTHLPSLPSLTRPPLALPSNTSLPHCSQLLPFDIQIKMQWGSEHRMKFWQALLRFKLHKLEPFANLLSIFSQSKQLLQGSAPYSDLKKMYCKTSLATLPLSLNAFTNAVSLPGTHKSNGERDAKGALKRAIMFLSVEVLSITTTNIFYDLVELHFFITRHLIKIN